MAEIPGRGYEEQRTCSLSKWRQREFRQVRGEGDYRALSAAPLKLASAVVVGNKVTIIGGGLQSPRKH